MFMVALFVITKKQEKTQMLFVGVQGMWPQDIQQWHTDYFELKLFKKQPVLEHTDPSLSPKSRK